MSNNHFRRMLTTGCLFTLIVGAAHADDASNKIAMLAGQWDLPGTRTTIEIRPDGSVQHWSLGSGDIRFEHGNFFIVQYRQHHLECHYEIKKYNDNELSMIIASRPSPDDCELGLLRRAPNDPDTSARSDSTGSPEPQSNQQSQSTSPRQNSSTKEFKDCENCPEMVEVPAGNFLMGSPETEANRTRDEGPQRRVVFHRPFAVGKYPVTLDQFRAFVSATGRRTGDKCGANDDWDTLSEGSYEAPPGFADGFVQTGRSPVVCVSWNDAKAYVAWLSAQTKQTYRLLSEAEREYITRAGTTTAYWWGNGITPAQALYDTRPEPKPAKKPKAGTKADPVGNVSFRGRTAVVDSYRPNDWGIFQVHGNVDDLTEDCWTGTIASSSDSGAAVQEENCKLHVGKGGAWSYQPSALRAAFRDPVPAAGRYNHIGFRVARDLPAKN